MKRDFIMDEIIVKKLLGLRIKQLRKNKKLTQFALGELIDIDQRQIAYLEGGNSFPSLKTLIKFSNVFGCKIQDLFNYEHLHDKVDVKTKIKEKISSMDNDTLKMLYQIADVVTNYKIMK